MTPLWMYQKPCFHYALRRWQGCGYESMQPQLGRRAPTIARQRRQYAASGEDGGLNPLFYVFFSSEVADRFCVHVPSESIARWRRVL